MKKLLFFLMLLCFSVSAKAQLYAGGSLGMQVLHVGANGVSSTSSVFSIAPELGYDINSEWAVGVSVPIGYQDNGNYNVTIVKVLPYVRATFARVSIADFFGELAFGYTNESSEGFGLGGFESGLRPGMKLNFTDRFALVCRTTLLSYSHYDGANMINFAVNNAFDLGFKVSF